MGAVSLGPSYDLSQTAQLNPPNRQLSKSDVLGTFDTNKDGKIGETQSTQGTTGVTEADAARANLGEASDAIINHVNDDSVALTDVVARLSRQEEAGAIPEFSAVDQSVAFPPKSNNLLDQLLNSSRELNQSLGELNERQANIDRELKELDALGPLMEAKRKETEALRQKLGLPD